MVNQIWEKCQQFSSRAFYLLGVTIISSNQGTSVLPRGVFSVTVFLLTSRLGYFLQKISR